MKTYPTVITAEILERHKAISDERLARDIAETEAEIAGYKATMDSEREIARTHPDPHQRKLADFRAGARPGQIAERETFVAFLLLLKAGRDAARH